MNRLFYRFLWIFEISKITIKEIYKKTLKNLIVREKLYFSSYQDIFLVCTGFYTVEYSKNPSNYRRLHIYKKSMSFSCWQKYLDFLEDVFIV